MADEEYELVDVDFTEDDIEAYIVDENDKEIGFIVLDEEGNEVEYYYADDEEEGEGKPAEKDRKAGADDDNPYDPGITAEGVAETTSNMNDIYRDGVAIVGELKGAFDDIAEVLDFSSILGKKKK